MPKSDRLKSSSVFSHIIGKSAGALYVLSGTKFPEPLSPTSPVARAAVPAISPLRPRVIQSEAKNPGSFFPSPCKETFA
jgi:hypothetical protein